MAYIYKWYNIDNGEVFYIGKGKRDRWKNIHKRNKEWNEYYNNNNCNSIIIEDDLTDECAYELENILILEYWSLGQCSCNIDEGGRKGGSAIGERNSQYGVSPKDRMSHEVYEQWKTKHKTSCGGTNNSQYGVSPKNRMSHEVYEQWKKKQKERKFGKSNPKAKPCRMTSLDGNTVIDFDYIKECAEYLMKENLTTAKSIVSVQSNISVAISKNKTYLNYYFEFI